MSHLNQFRDSAIAKITQVLGKQNYNTGSTVDAKQDGYGLFRQGVQELINYMKMETNESLKKMTAERVDQFIQELQAMKTYLGQFSAQPQSLIMGDNQFTPLTKISSQEEKREENKTVSPNVSKIKNTNSAEDDKLKSNLEGAIVTEKPNITWDDVAGLENAKKSLQEAVILPMRFPEIFTGARKPWMGILLYGPPGTGKTHLAKACATEADGTFFSVSSSDLISKFVGESERLIKQLFAMARERKPSIIFIDEIDSMCGTRDGNESEASRRVKTEFLVQMQGVGNNNDGILVLGATNLPWALDPAIRRRFEKRVYIPLPDMNGILSLLTNRLKDTPSNITPAELEQLSQMLDGYSGSDLGTLIRDASFEPLRRCERATTFKLVTTPEGDKKYMPCSPSDPEGKPMKMMQLQGGKLFLPHLDIDDFFSVLPKCKPSVCKDDLGKYVDWTKQFGQDG